MSISILHARVSFSWVSSFADDYTEASTLGSRARYVQEYRAAHDLSSKNPSAAWTLPWAPPDESGWVFWSYYLAKRYGDDLPKVEGPNAWKHLVPLRARCLGAIRPKRAQSQAPRISLQGWGFPHAAAVMVTFLFDRTTPIQQFVDQVCALEHQPYSFTAYHRPTTTEQTRMVREARADHVPVEAPSLSHAARLVLNELRSRVGVAPERRLLRPQEPLVIVTVLDAKGLGTESLDGQPDLHQALIGLAERSRSWRERISCNLGTVVNPEIMATTRPTQNDLLLLTRRSRVVWLPSLFGPDESLQPQHFLGTYHHNVSLAAMQTESLLALARYFVEVHQEHRCESLSEAENQLAHSAGGVLARLYGASKTYHSTSVYHQIHEASAVVEQLRLITKVSPDPRPLFAREPQPLSEDGPRVILHRI